MSKSMQPGDDSASRGGVVWYPASHQSHAHPVKGISPALTFSLESTHYSIRCEKSPTRCWKHGTIYQKQLAATYWYWATLEKVYLPCLIVNAEVLGKVCC